MTKGAAAADRAARIELLRVRAAIERELLAQAIVAASRQFEPAALFKNFLPSGRVSSGVSRWAMRAIGLARRYPFVSSSLSALLMRGGGKSKLFKLAGGALAGWQLFRIWRSARRDRGDAP